MIFVCGFFNVPEIIVIQKFSDFPEPACIDMHAFPTDLSEVKVTHDQYVFFFSSGHIVDKIEALILFIGVIYRDCDTQPL